MAQVAFQAHAVIAGLDGITVEVQGAGAQGVELADEFQQGFHHLDRCIGPVVFASVLDF